ncbi:MAG: gamma-glutamyltransferase [Aquisalimonadaceae bacterium]
MQLETKCVRRATTLVLVILLFLPASLLARETPPGDAVATAHPLATDVALEILDAGGNAFDAAVAVTAALAVVEPYGSGLGGGGFWLLHRAEDGFQTMVDGRETAPGEATHDMYLDEVGDVRDRASLDGALAAGIPGTPAALVHLVENYGRLSLAENLAPAIRYARNGFEVGPHYRRMVRFRMDALRASPDAAAVLLKDGDVPPEGHRIVQSDLADTLERLATSGREGFYRGETARMLVKAAREGGGIWRLEDFADYTVVEREPITGRYHGIRITAAAPPSAGGIGLVTMLGLLEPWDLSAMDEASRIHLAAEAMRRAYRDRSLYLGDPDFTDIPLRRLQSEDHLRLLREDLRLDQATPSDSLAAPPDGTGEDTTHFSIIDSDGNRVGATLSINYPFGSGFMAAGTGVLLNNEMDDFASQPGKPNAYGLVGGTRNAIAPGKRPLSSMTPTFLESEDRIAVLGTPGGSRIITQVLLAILAFAENEPPETWVSRPRFHHQYLPDRIQHEPGAITIETRNGLRQRGHSVVPMTREYGDMQAVSWHRRDNVMEAASDPRGGGRAEARVRN